MNERYMLSYAEDLLMQSCMKEAGFEWEPIAPPRQFLSVDS